jgi:hypothetical protein
VLWAISAMGSECAVVGACNECYYGVSFKYFSDELFCFTHTRAYTYTYSARGLARTTYYLKKNLLLYTYSLVSLYNPIRRNS